MPMNEYWAHHKVNRLEMQCQRCLMAKQVNYVSAFPSRM